MKLLVGIQAHGRAQDTISVTSSSWGLSGGELLGLHGEDCPVSEWPDSFIETPPIPVHQGKSLGYGLHPFMMADSFKRLTDCAEEMGFDWVLWTECDSVFFGQAPNLAIGNFYCFIAGYCPPEWKCGRGPFLHPPFFTDIRTARRWCQNIPINVLGNGTPDVFSAIICELARIPIVSCPGVWSTNGLDMRVASKMEEAHRQLQAGAWHIHGIKRQDHLDFITGRSQSFPADTIYQ